MNDTPNGSAPDGQPMVYSDKTEQDRMVLYAEIERLRDAQQWQPIETARNTLRDTRARLVWCPDRQNIYEVSWRDGWLIWGSSTVLTENPTHWMPLPEPPDVP